MLEIKRTCCTLCIFWNISPILIIMCNIISNLFSHDFLYNLILKFLRHLSENMLNMFPQLIHFLFLFKVMKHIRPGMKEYQLERLVCSNLFVSPSMHHIIRGTSVNHFNCFVY